MQTQKIRSMLAAGVCAAAALGVLTHGTACQMSVFAQRDGAALETQVKFFLSGYLVDLP